MESTLQVSRSKQKIVNDTIRLLTPWGFLLSGIIIFLVGCQSPNEKVAEYSVTLCSTAIAAGAGLAQNRVKDENNT